MRNEKRAWSKKRGLCAAVSLVAAVIWTLSAVADPEPKGETTMTPANPETALLNTAAAQLAVKTSTGGGANHGITYTITVNASLPVNAAFGSLKSVTGSDSFVLVKALAPALSDGSFSLPLNLDEDASAGVTATQMTVAGSTSIGLRGQGEMPTVLHPRVELLFKDKKGDYGSALLIKQLEPVAFVSRRLASGSDDKASAVVVAYDFKKTHSTASGGFMDETTFKPSRVVVWQYDQAQLSAIANDSKSESNAVVAAKAILQKMDER